MSNSLESQASKPRLGLNFNNGMTTGASAPTDSTPMATTTPAGAAENFGGMTFGKAINPTGSAYQQQQLDMIANQNESAAAAAMFTQQGRAALKTVPDQMKAATAAKYGELFAVAGVEPTESQKTNIARLQALEGHQTKTAALGLQFQTAPMQVAGEIAKLRASLDADTLQIRTQAARTVMVKAKLEQQNAEADLLNAEVYDVLDKFATGDLQKMVVDGSFRKAHPDASVTDVLELLKERRDAGDPYQPEAMTPDKRANMVQQRLGALNLEQRHGLLQVLQQEGPMAYMQLPNPPVQATGKETPEQLRQKQGQFDAIQQRNAQMTFYGKLLGGLNPTLDEVTASYANLLESSMKAGVGPATMTEANRQAIDLTKVEVEQAGRQTVFANEIGVPIDPASATAYASQLGALTTKEMLTADPRQSATIREQRAKLVSEFPKAVGDAVDARTSNKDIRAALKGFIHSGDFQTQDAGLHALAFMGASGAPLTGDTRAVDYKMTGPDGSEQLIRLPIGSAAAEANKYLRATVGDATRQLDSADDIVKQAMSEAAKKNKGKKGQTYDQQFDEDAWAAGLKAVRGVPAFSVARGLYTTHLYKQGLAIALKDAVGSRNEDNALYNQIIEVSPTTGALTLSPKFTSRRDGSSIDSPDMAKIADFLQKQNRGDILGTIAGNMDKKEYIDSLAARLRPGTAAEKATYAYLFGNDRMVLVRANSANPIIIGSTAPDSLLYHTFVRDIMQVAKKEQAAAVGRVEKQDRAKELIDGLMQNMAFGTF